MADLKEALQQIKQVFSSMQAAADVAVAAVADIDPALFSGDNERESQFKKLRGDLLRNRDELKSSIERLNSAIA